MFWAITLLVHQVLDVPMDCTRVQQAAYSEGRLALVIKLYLNEMWSRQGQVTGEKKLVTMSF